MPKSLVLLFFGLLPFLLHAQDKASATSERLMLDWPDNQFYKKISSTDEDGIRQWEFIPDQETKDNWTSLVNMTMERGVNISVDTEMNRMRHILKNSNPGANLIFIRRGKTQSCPWILYSVEGPEYIGEAARSSLFHVIKGKQALYINSVTVKESKLPEEIKANWPSYFESAKLFYR